MTLFKTLLKIAAYLLYLCCIVAVALEVLLRLFFPITDMRSGTFRQNIPGLKTQIVYEKGIEDDFRSSSVKSLADKKGKRTIRILCIGASTTHQPTQETEDMWSSRLEQNLQEVFRKDNIDISVIAVGVGGWCVDNGRRFLMEKLERYSPDIVMTLWGDQ